MPLHKFGSKPIGSSLFQKVSYKDEEKIGLENILEGDDYEAVSSC